jgi:hypothetical protein
MPKALEIIVSLKDKLSPVAKRVSSAFKTMGTSAEKGTDEITKGSKKAQASLGSLKETALNLKTAFIGFVTGAIIAGLTRMAEAAETLDARLRVATKSTEGMVEAQATINKVLSSTPLNADEATNAYIRLKNLGLEPTAASIISFGNTAAAMGLPLQQFIEAVADASTFEFERLKEFGITAKQELDTVSFTFQNTTTTIKKNAQSIQEYLKSIGETKFSSALNAQSDTIAGKIKEATGAIRSLAIAVGDAGWTGAVKGFYSTLSGITKEATKGIQESANAIGQALHIVLGTFKFVVGAIKVVWNGIQIFFREGILVINKALESLTHALSLVTFGELSKNLRENAEEIHKQNQLLAASIKEDAEDIAKGVEFMATAFDKQTEVVKEANEDLTEVIAERNQIGSNASAESISTEKKATADLKKALKEKERELDRHNKAMNKIREDGLTAQKEFDALLNEVLGVSDKAPEDITGTDTLRPIQNITDSLSNSDFTGALEGITKVNEMIRAMVASGNESEATLYAMVQEMRALSEEARKGIAGEEIVKTAASIEGIEGLKETIQGVSTTIDEVRNGAAGSPITIPLNVDDELSNKIKAAIAAATAGIEPIVVPVEVKIIKRGQSDFTDGTDVNREAEREIEKRGSNG